MISLTFYPEDGKEILTLSVASLSYVKERKQFEVHFNSGIFYVLPVDIISIQ